MHPLGSLLDSLHRGGPWLGPALGCTSLIASLALIGLSIPLTAILITCGAASGGRALGPTVIPWIIAGAFLGNLISYEFGRHLRAHGFGFPRLPARARDLTDALFVRHGALAIVVARYTGPPTLAPFIAGWSLLSRPRFMAANAAASLTWPPLVVAVGSLGAWLSTQ